jgi:5-methylcytosine-specific restriction endonuclease McrA
MQNDFMTNYVQKKSDLSYCPALVLNADFRPMSYFPLSLWTWQDAVKAAYLDRVTILAEYEDIVHSQRSEIKIPSVVVLKDYVKPTKSTAFTRFNLFLRDEFTCQYCGAAGDLTFDHVIPRASGGRTTWENVVASCSPCNLRKGSKSLRQASMSLQRLPVQPNPAALMNSGRKFPPNHLHESWMDFLYWDAELDA